MTNIIKRSLIYGVLTLSCGVGAAIMITSTAAMNRAEYVSTERIGRLDRVWELAKYNAAQREFTGLKEKLDYCIAVNNRDKNRCTRSLMIPVVSRAQELLTILKRHLEIVKVDLHGAEQKSRAAQRRLETIKYGHASSNLGGMSEPLPPERK